MPAVLLVAVERNPCAQTPPIDPTAPKSTRNGAGRGYHPALPHKYRPHNVADALKGATLPGAAGSICREAPGASQLPVPQPAVLDDALLGLIVDIDDPEAFRVTERPFEVVQERPNEIAPAPARRRPWPEGRRQCEISGSPCRPWSWTALPSSVVIECGPVLGDVNGRQLVAVVGLGDDPVQAFGADGPVHRGPGCLGFVHARRSPANLRDVLRA